MNKNFIIKLIIIIIAFVIILTMLSLLFINKNISVKNNNSNTENELNNGNVNIYDEQENNQTQLGEAKLYITCDDKTITAYHFEGDFEEYFEKNLKEKSKEYHTNFNNLWEMMDIEAITSKLGSELTLIYQYSRYGYAKDDLDFNFTNKLFSLYERFIWLYKCRIYILYIKYAKK